MKKKNAEFKETSPYFEHAVLADSITNPYAREYRTLIFAFEGAKIDMNRRLKIEIEEVKKRMAINFIIDKTEMREGYDRIIPI